ncbi:MAG: LarC family nickel insertion protein, partial [Thermodesulfobacteriota bacterium]
MNILYYDCFSGISGDMNLAAMIQLGVDPNDLRRELSKLGLDDEFRLTTARDSRNGIVGTRVDVTLTHPDRQVHRSLLDIETVIGNSRLDEPVRLTALRIFRKLAEAEAKVHGTEIQKIHFHEVGAVDAMVDIVGAAICYHSLQVDQVWSSPVELGGGFVRCAHGRLPVPAPATAEILTGIPTTRGAVRQETTTPTGAAILATLVDRFSDSPR